MKHILSFLKSVDCATFLCTLLLATRHIILHSDFLLDRKEEEVGYEMFAATTEPEDDCDVIEFELFDTPPLNTYLVEPQESKMTLVKVSADFKLIVYTYNHNLGLRDGFILNPSWTYEKMNNE